MEDFTQDLEKFRALLTCPCGCGHNRTTFEFISKLYMAQGLFGKPFLIYQGFRCTKFNDFVGAAQDSPALTGEHIDLSFETPKDLFFLIKSLLAAGFERFRLYPHHLHVDQDPNFSTPSFSWNNYPPKKPIQHPLPAFQDITGDG